jgi:hypothetical protein
MDNDTLLAVQDYFLQGLSDWRYVHESHEEATFDPPLILTSSRSSTVNKWIVNIWTEDHPVYRSSGIAQLRFYDKQLEAMKRSERVNRTIFKLLDYADPDARQKLWDFFQVCMTKAIMYQELMSKR